MKFNSIMRNSILRNENLIMRNNPVLNDNFVMKNDFVSKSSISLSFKSDIYKKVRQIIFNKYSYPIEQIQIEVDFKRDLAVDSYEMFQLMTEFEEVFEIIISLDDIDKFTFQPQKIVYISDIKTIDVNLAVDYIEAKLILKRHFILRDQNFK